MTDTVIARDSSDEEEERGCKLPEAKTGKVDGNGSDLRLAFTGQNHLQNHLYVHTEILSFGIRETYSVSMHSSYSIRIQPDFSTPTMQSASHLCM